MYTLRSDVEPLREDRKARRLLFRPMEALMCGGDPDLILRELKEKDNPPNVCGRVFKMGEPTYSCRDCGVDPTCVLCINCFQNSAHNTHRYKVFVEYLIMIIEKLQFGSSEYLPNFNIKENKINC